MFEVDVVCGVYGACVEYEVVEGCEELGVYADVGGPGGRVSA